MNILVTGVCGYIGQYLSTVFNDNQHKVFGIDLIGSPSIELLKNIDKYICADLSKNKLSEEILKNIDVVIHLAGEASLKSKKDKFMVNNIDATLNLINSLNDQVKKIVFLSSIKIKDGNDYSRTKLAAEDIIKNGAKEKNISYTILRSSAVYGIGMKSNILYWLKKVYKNEIGAIPQSSSELAMIGLDDLAMLIKACCDNCRSDNKTYEVSDGVSYSINKLELEARRLSNNSCNVGYYPKWLLYLGSKIGDIAKIFGLNLVLDSRSYNLFFKNTVEHNTSIFDDLCCHPKQNFFKEMPNLLKE